MHRAARPQQLILADHAMLITIDSIGRVHIVLTETGENALIQPQLITPSTTRDGAQRQIEGELAAGHSHCPSDWSTDGVALIARDGVSRGTL